MLLRRIYHDGLAHASYFIGCEQTHQALVIDPNRDINQYLELAEREHMQIVAVTETHLHADFISGARELAFRAHSRLYVSGCGPKELRYRFDREMNVSMLQDGDSFDIGTIHFTVWNTPGHTLEHISLLVEDTNNPGFLLGAFTGDFLYVGDIGRPDVPENSDRDTVETLAIQLYGALQRMRQLPEWIQLWPAHGAGNPYGGTLGDLAQSTLGYEIRTNWAFQIQSEQAFIQHIHNNQPNVPPYFTELKQRNREGPLMLRDLPPLRGSAPEDLETMIEQAIVLDTRTPTAFASQHIPGTLNLPEGEPFITWAGWLIPNNSELGLIGDSDHVANLADELRLIGINNISAFWTPDIIHTWKQKHSVGRINRVSVQVSLDLFLQQKITVVDVRKAEEYHRGHIPHSINTPLEYFREQRNNIPRQQPILIYCQRDMRSNAAASLLSGLTNHPIYLMIGGFDAWKSARGPVDTFKQPR